jgi:hypothetical protein
MKEASMRILGLIAAALVAARMLSNLAYNRQFAALPVPVRNQRRRWL